MGTWQWWGALTCEVRPGLGTFTGGGEPGAVSVPHRRVLPADLASGSWGSLQGCSPAVLHGAGVSRLAALGKGAGS